MSVKVSYAENDSIPLEAALVDPQALDLRLERRRRHSQLRRSARQPRDFAARLGQCGFDDLSLLAVQVLVERSPLRLLSSRPGREPVRVDGEFVRVTKDHRPLDHVLQLADVSRPVVRLQQIKALPTAAAT